MKPNTCSLSHSTLRSILPWLLAVFLSMALAACVYRPDVQQGNEITWEMISQIRPGMTRRQVVRILGQPLVNDPFNKNRWDYFYSFRSGETGNLTKQSIILRFEGDNLVTVDSDLLPDQEPRSATD